MEPLDLSETTAGLANEESDCCAYCNDHMDDECVMVYGKRWHVKPPHLSCSTCKRDLTHDLASAVYSEREDKVYCINHSSRAQETVSDFSHVTKLQQYVFLLNVALARLLKVLKSDNAEGHRLSPKTERERKMGSRSKSYADAPRDVQPEESSPQRTLREMKTLRPPRDERTLSTTFRKARESRILDWAARSAARFTE